MEWRPMLVGTAASVSFMTLSLAGALTLAGQSPAARPLQPAVRAQPDPLPPVPLPLSPLPPAPVPLPPLPVRLDASADAAPGAPAAGPESGPRAVPARPAPPVAERPRRDAPPVRVAALVPPLRPEARAQPAVLPPPRIRPEREGAARESGAEGVVTPSRLRRFRSALRLTREQEPLWQPVEQALRRIGDEQAALIRAGQDPREAFGFVAAMRIYAVARPFLDGLREDQRGQVRAQARGMGFGAVAAQI